MRFLGSVQWLLDFSSVKTHMKCGSSAHVLDHSGVCGMLGQQPVGYFSHKNFTKLYTELFFTSGSPTQEIILGRDVVLENQSALIKKKIIHKPQYFSY